MPRFRRAATIAERFLREQSRQDEDATSGAPDASQSAKGAAQQTAAPAAAARLCSACPQARDHFLSARRKQIWSLGLANIGVVQSVTGAVQLENEHAVGAFNAAVGGFWMTLGAARDRAARREVKSAVEAYNRCQFFER